MITKLLKIAIVGFLFLECNFSYYNEDFDEKDELKEANLTFEKISLLRLNTKTISTAQLLKQIKGNEKEGFTIKNIAVNDETIAQVEGTKPNFSIKIKQSRTFKANIVLEKTGFLDVTLNHCEFSYEFDFIYGDSGDKANAIVETSDGNWVVAGETDSYIKGAGKNDFWVFKLNKNNGNIIWEKTYGDHSYDWANTIVETSDGNLVVGGNFRVLKINKTGGNIIWEKEYKWLTAANSIIETSDGNLAIAGDTFNRRSDVWDFWILEVDKENGSVIWQKTYGGSYYSEANAIVETSDGNLAVAGYKENAAKKEIFWVLKLNKNNGNILWEKTYGSSSSGASSIIETSDGHLAVAGYNRVLKINKENGNIIWKKTTYGGYSIIETSDGNLAVAGHEVLKLNKNNGNIIWKKNYRGSANAIIETSDRNLVVAGNIWSRVTFEGGGIWVLKLYGNDGAIVGSR